MMSRSFTSAVLYSLLFASVAACSDDPEPSADADQSDDAAVEQDADLDTQDTGNSGGDELDGAEQPTAVEIVASSGETLTIDSQSFEVWLDDPELRFSLSDLSLGWSEAISSTVNYDPTFLYEPPELAGPAVPTDLAWSAVTSATFADIETDSVTVQLDLVDGAGVATMTVSATGEGTFRFQLTPPDELGVLYTRVTLPLGDDEGLYGLGELFDGVELRGRLKPMQLQLDAESESGHNEVHVPVPFVVATSGWGGFIESHAPGVFAVDWESSGLVEGVFTQEALTFYLYAAETPLEVVERHSAVAGRIPMPPPWTLGMWLWRNENDSSAEVVGDAEALREHGIASSAIWIDRPWQSYHESFDFDEGRFEEPDQMIADLQRLGFRVAVWTSPYVAESSPVYDMVNENGWLVDGDSWLLNSFGIAVDFTIPEAMTWWQDRVTTLHERGIDGFKLDYGEDIQLGLGGARMNYRFANGEDERTMHHRYMDLYHIAHDEPIGYEEGFFIARGGTYEGMKYVTCIWPGDLDNSFVFHGEDSHVGGLPAAVSGGLSLSASGYPLYASDTGGYRHGRASKEVLMRWTAYSWLLPIMQLGGSSDHNPWNFDNYDEETLSVVRQYANLHTRWFPYFYSLVERAHETGRPMNPPFGLAWPETGEHPDDQFAVGGYVMAAPVVTDADGRTVVFPEGDWVSWWDGSVVSGPGEQTFDVPYDEVPLYLTAGAILPMLGEEVKTISPTTEEGVVSWLDEPGRLWTRIVPADGAAFEVHDGSSYEVTVGEGRIEVAIEDGDTYDGHILEVWSDQEVTQVTADGETLDLVEFEPNTTCDGCWATSEWGYLINPGSGAAQVVLTR